MISCGESRQIMNHDDFDPTNSYGVNETKDVVVAGEPQVKVNYRSKEYERWNSWCYVPKVNG